MALFLQVSSLQPSLWLQPCLGEQGRDVPSRHTSLQPLRGFSLCKHYVISATVFPSSASLGSEVRGLIWWLLPKGNYQGAPYIFCQNTALWSKSFYLVELEGDLLVPRAPPSPSAPFSFLGCSDTLRICTLLSWEVAAAVVPAPREDTHMVAPRNHFLWQTALLCCGNTLQVAVCHLELISSF